MSNFYKRFIELKNEIKVPKDIKNNFGKFMYRSKEQIQEKLKPLELKHNIIINVEEDVVVISERLFAKATAKAIDVETGEAKIEAVGFAEFQKLAGTKMNESQLSGSASSYAGKYALQNLLGLDDNKDADDEKQTPRSKNKPDVELELEEGVVDEQKRTQVEIRNATLKATTAEELNELMKDADDTTLNMINMKGKMLKLVYDEKNKKWGNE